MPITSLPRPCTCDKCKKDGSRYDSGQCYVCWRFWNNPVYFQLHGGLRGGSQDVPSVPAAIPVIVSPPSSSQEIPAPAPVRRGIDRSKPRVQISERVQQLRH